MNPSLARSLVDSRSSLDQKAAARYHHRHQDELGASQTGMVLRSRAGWALVDLGLRLAVRRPARRAIAR